MDIHFTVLALCVLHKLDYVIEDTSNILFVVVSQKVRLVYHTISLVVVRRIVSGTVHYVSDSQFLKCLFVPCDDVTSQEKETVDDLRAYLFIEFIFIFFPCSSFIVKVGVS